jgi:PilZ domain
MTDDKRRAPRPRVLKGAKIVALDQWLLVDCHIRDVSETGAKIICKDQLSVPTEFRLPIPKDNTIQTARVVWRKGDMVGVTFTSERTRAPARKS